MMNATEAAKKTNAYIENNANAIIAEIDKSICENADNGLTYTYYDFDPSVRSAVRNQVIATIKEAGYTCHMANNGSLQILWHR